MSAKPNAHAKARFMESNVRISNHREMIGSEAFEKGSDAALLHYIDIIAKSNNPNEAMAIGLKIQGATEFLQTFKLLAETPKLPSPVITDNLNPKA